MVAGIFDETMLSFRKCAGLELSREPFCCAVSLEHPLAAKDRLEITDLYGEKLLLMHRKWSHYVDQLRDEIWKNHPQIHIVDFDFYSTDIFNRCESSNAVLLAIPGWANVHPLLKVIPVNWEYTIPYGLLHSPHPTKTVRAFWTWSERSAPMDNQKVYADQPRETSIGASLFVYCTLKE